MVLRTFVGFVAEFPTDRHEDGTPAGRELAEYVAAQLRVEGINASEPRDGGWAWHITGKLKGITIETTVGYVDDMQTEPPRQWLITNQKVVSPWSWLFDSIKEKERKNGMMRRYCIVLHEALSNDERISHVLWYDEKTFDKPGDIPALTP